MHLQKGGMVSGRAQQHQGLAPVVPIMARASFSRVYLKIRLPHQPYTCSEHAAMTPAILGVRAYLCLEPQQLCIIILIGPSGRRSCQEGEHPQCLTQDMQIGKTASDLGRCPLVCAAP